MPPFKLEESQYITELTIRKQIAEIENLKTFNLRSIYFEMRIVVIERSNKSSWKKFKLTNGLNIQIDTANQTSDREIS